MSTQRIGIFAAIAVAGVVIIVGALYFEGVFGTSQLFCVKMGDKWGYVNSAGKYVINPQFDRAEVFAGELAQVPHHLSSLRPFLWPWLVPGPASWVSLRSYQIRPYVEIKPFRHCSSRL